MSCWLAQFASDACQYREDGRADRCHFAPAQRLRQAGLTDEQVWDRRAYEMGCRHHHHALDNGFITLEIEHYPWPFRQYAEEHGLFFVPGRGWLVGDTSGIGWPE